MADDNPAFLQELTSVLGVEFDIVATALAKAPEHPPIVICSVESDPEIVAAAQSAGASGFVFKARIENDLICALKSALKGKFFVSQQPVD